VVDDDGHLIGNLSRRELMRMMLAMERVESDNPAQASTVSGTAKPSRSEATRVVPAPRSAQIARKPLATV
jgi:hypothetical protein